MKLVTCPEESLDKFDNKTRIFLAGGISNCPDWQKEMAQRFKDCDDDLILINPRRTDFNIDDPKESEFQITWEFMHLDQSDAVLFWFPFQTLCPITLYELGFQKAMQKPVFVGAHPAYARKFDLEFQMKMAGHPLPVVSSFSALVEQVKFWYDN